MENPRFEGETYVALYGRAFETYGAIALWNRRQLADPTSADALAVARALRIEDDPAARQLTEEIEAACRAAY